MPFPRSTAFRFVSQAARPAARSSFRSAGAAWQRTSQQGARRYASSSGHSHQAGSDVPWAIGATVVTIPGVWYMLQPGADHGHHEEHAKHEEKHEEPEEEPEEAPKEESAPEDKQVPKVSETEGKDQVSNKESDELQKPQNQDTPEGESKSKDESHMTSTPDNKGSVEGVRFKGSTNQGDSDNAAEDTRSHVPDAKGGAKKRIDSGYGTPIGSESAERDAKGSSKDKVSCHFAASSKESLSQNQQSGKQEGLSNTDTKHSTDPVSDPNKSTKGEGTAETAKVKGTVSPNRPSVSCPRPQAPS
ncbi:uncharacterized protein K452DRAFT_235859 [Aplosporella prunicola CBS 121167]|uniref:Uncharacterized protein n=1 Tax=Aplosporella prunicola CBS 121167 TaxID=1176127 RepID=A0A6A6B2K9_9PEZI|nr:uncharacterized protein K452DRAFT_235859 [Aplosporella prunicola CBS 121167]KAF2137454.1 hypothetical protein K452DRAFT_235859 [Aplosporella prunicola CBS 121167]